MTKTNQQILNAEVTHAELQASIIQLATLKGYEHFHNLHPEGSDPGWPDLVLAKVTENPYSNPDERYGIGYSIRASYMDKPFFIFMEIKREGQSPTDEQFFWLETMRLAGFKVYVIWPSDFSSGFVEKIL